METAKIKQIIILVLILLGILSIYVTILYFLSALITTMGSILLGIVLILLLLRFICTTLVFPGSLWIYQRSLEAYFRKEFSSHVYRRLEDFCGTLVALKEKANIDYGMLDAAAGVKTTLNSLEHCLTVLETTGKISK